MQSYQEKGYQIYLQEAHRWKASGDKILKWNNASKQH